MKNKMQDNNNSEEKNLDVSFKTTTGMSVLKVRTLSAIILLILLSLYVLTGALYSYLPNSKNIEIASYFSILMNIAVLAISIFEINRALGFKKWYQQLILISLNVILYLFPVSKDLYNFSFYRLLNMDNWFATWQFTLLFPMIFLFYIILGLLDKSIGFKNTGINFVICLLITFGMKAFTITSLDLQRPYNTTPEYSFNTAVWIWLMIIFADTFAYIGGVNLGKTPLAPKISPKKTWEGALIGLSSATVFGIIYSVIFLYLLPDFKPFNSAISELQSRSGNNYTVIAFYVIFSLLFPIIGLFGDLLFSWVKRSANIKDFSKIIPGHGGFLDRMDSVILSFAVLFLIIVFV